MERKTAPAPRVMNAGERKRIEDAKAAQDAIDNAKALEEWELSLDVGPEPSNGRNGQQSSNFGRSSNNGPPKKLRAIDIMRGFTRVPQPRPDDDYDSDNENSRTGVGQARKPEIPRLSVQLTGLPPNTTSETVQNLVQDYLRVSSVRVLPGKEANSRSVQAVVVLSSDSVGANISSAIEACHKRYLGRGYTLGMDRYLTSEAAIQDQIDALRPVVVQPYGAEKTPYVDTRSSLRNVPPPNFRNMPPPGSNHDRSASSRAPDVDRRYEATVKVQPPSDIGTTRAINLLVSDFLAQDNFERVLEIEALLMAQKRVQHDKRFAFLFDAKSQAGLYYRYKLWQSYDSQAQQRKSKEPRTECVDRAYDVGWAAPVNEPFPDLHDIKNVTADVDYESFEDYALDDEADGEKIAIAYEEKHLRPLQQAQLTYLLARLPRSLEHLLWHQVGGVSYFAIRHASHGAQEIVNLLVLNVAMPFSWTAATQHREGRAESGRKNSEGSSSGTEDTGTRKPRGEDDLSVAKYIGLLIVSDTLSAAACAGVKNCWRFTELLTTGMREQKTFRHLGRVPKQMGWGKLRSEKWKKEIEKLLDFWSAKVSMKLDALREFRRELREPELSWREKAAEQEKVAAEAAAAASKVQSKAVAQTLDKLQDVEDVDGVPMEDVDGVPMEDVDGVPMEDIDGISMEDMDGVPMEDIDDEPMEDIDEAPPKDQAIRRGSLPNHADEVSMEKNADKVSITSGAVSEDKPVKFALNPSVSLAPAKILAGPSALPKKRRRSEDNMFADSSDDD